MAYSSFDLAELTKRAASDIDAILRGVGKPKIQSLSGHRTGTQSPIGRARSA